MEFTATTSDLKKALSVVSLAVGDAPETIYGHALFDFKDNQAFLYASDNDRMAMAYLPVSDLVIDKDEQFTADPKKIQKLISGSDSATVKFVYDKETKTLNIYASESSEAYVSFASFDPDSFLTFDKDLAKATDIKTVDATVFLAGIEFIQGFLPSDDSNKKYSNLYVVDGVMYGSNGSFKIGAYQSTDLEGTSITLRRLMIPPIGAVIDITKASEITLAETEKIIVISTKDQLYRFAFRKTTIPVPKLPITMTVPIVDSFTVDRSTLIKKLNRLSLTSKDEVGIKMSISGEVLSLETVADRKSYEKMACKRLVGDKDLNFTMECNKLRGILGFYQASSVDFYIDAIKCTLYSDATLITEEKGKEPVSKKFVAAGVLTLAAVV
jgi:hypothetical protein